MGTQDKFGDTLSKLIAPGLFQDTRKACYSPENGAAVVARALNLSGRAFLKVSGKSMLPWFRPGDIVFLRKKDLSQMSRGDVVVFEREGHLCMHRVITLSGARNSERSNAWFVTKGDSVVETDEPIRAEDFRGQIEFLYRNGREIRLDSGWRTLFAKFLAVISPVSRFWLPHFCRVKNRLDDVTASGCEPQGPSSPENWHSV